MWIFSTSFTVVYKLDRNRSAKVPKEHFGVEEEGILVVDHLSSYKAMGKESNGLYNEKCGKFTLLLWGAIVEQTFLSINPFIQYHIT